MQKSGAARECLSLGDAERIRLPQLPGPFIPKSVLYAQDRDGDRCSGLFVNNMDNCAKLEEREEESCSLIVAVRERRYAVPICYERERRWGQPSSGLRSAELW